MKIKLVFLTLLLIIENVYAGDGVSWKEINDPNTIVKTIPCVEKNINHNVYCTSISGVLKGDKKFRETYIKSWKDTGRNIKDTLSIISDFRIINIDNTKYLYWDMWCKYEKCVDLYNINTTYMLYNMDNENIIGIFTDKNDKKNIVGTPNEREKQYLEVLLKKGGIND